MIQKTGWLVVFTLCCFHSYSQQGFDSLLDKLHSGYPQEKIHIQLDKSYYSAGETIWFKAYIMSGELPSKISNTLYAEIIDDRGLILQRKTMPVFQGGAASQFELPDTIKFSRLYLRAYTSWMLNFDYSLLYLKPLNIVIPNQSMQKRDTARFFTLSFFPEGGDLVENVPSRMAFKTNDHSGKPFAVSGSITDARGKAIVEFKSTHNGMGYVNILPQADEAYKASWKDPEGLRHETVLPPVKRGTATLSLQQKNGLISFTVARPENVTDDFKEYMLVAQMQQELVYAAKINLAVKTKATSTVPTDSLPDGIVQFTLFNKKQVPVAERIVFVNNGGSPFITDVHIVEKNIKPRGKNVLQVDVGGQLKSNLSVSVTDAGLDSTEGSRENIFSELLLTGDIKGYVYDPAYYFLSDQDSVKQQLDLVMMTNGWRRFSWEKVLSNQWPVIKYTPDNYLSIQGNIFGLSESRLSGKSLTGILQASNKGSSSVIPIPINKDGSFMLSGLYFFDTVKLYYQINNDKNRLLTTAATFKFNNSFVKYPSIEPQALADLYYPYKIPKEILLKSISQNELTLAQLKRQNIKVLETVTVVGKQKSLAEKLDKEYTSSLFSSMNARVFAIDDDPFAQSARTVLDYLRGRVPGLTIPMGFDGQITRRGSVVELFLDEMNTDVNLLESISMADVALVKVFDPPFVGARGGGPGGAIAVYTRKGGSRETGQGLTSTTLYGYSGIKEFYVPDYENNAAPAGRDLRTTLYWNPFLLFDANNKRITIPFFNNDNCKRLRVVIEGLNEVGQLTREEKFFE
jgi:hypothetical protein